MKKMKENSPLKELCPEKKITNHSARKTVVKKLKSSGVSKCEINIDYFMVGECVRFLFTSCEESQMNE